MNLTDLTPEERVVLVGLVKMFVDADGQSTADEMAEFRAIADELGRKEFDVAFRDAAPRFTSVDSALAEASKVSHAYAREMIHTVLYDLAAADGVSAEERELLKKIEAVWEIHSVRD